MKILTPEQWKQFDYLLMPDNEVPYITDKKAICFAQAALTRAETLQEVVAWLEEHNQNNQPQDKALVLFAEDWQKLKEIA